MNDPASLSSDSSSPARMLADMYERAHLPAALLDSDFKLLWCSAQALTLWPLLASVDGTAGLLGGIQPADIRGEIAHCGFFCTPGGADNLFAEHPAILFAAPPECGGHYLLQPLSDSPRAFAASPGGLRPEGLNRSIASFESHYRMPIASIFSTLSVLRKELDQKHINPELTPYFASLQQNTYALLRCTQMVAEYTRLSNGMLLLKPVYVELYGFLRTLLQDAAALTESISIPLSFKLPDSMLETQCDVGRLNAVLLNLLSNACRFTRPGNRIDVRVRRTKSRLIVSVRDQGIGMSEQTLARVFEPYYSHSPIGEPFAGNGLGLAIAQKSALLMGGTLALVSEEGVGTTATFSIPVPKPETSANAALHSEPSYYLKDRMSVLRIMLSDCVPYPF